MSDALDERAVLEALGEVAAPEVRDAGPEPDIARRRVLHLQSADPLRGLDDRAGRTFEQELPGEQRPVERALRQDALRSGACGHSSDERREEPEHRRRPGVALGEAVGRSGAQTSSSDSRRPNVTSFQRNISAIGWSVG